MTIETNLEEQIDQDSCGPANVRTLILAQYGSAPSQAEIKAAIAFGQKNHFWCLPETIIRYLDKFFDQVRLIQDKESGLGKIDELLNENWAVMVLFQDIFPDKENPAGFANDGSNGHYAFITEVDEARGLIKIGDPSRLIPGNERFFDNEGVVAVTGEEVEGKQLALKAGYWVEAEKFKQLWFWS